jgi:hypothetical protein
MNKKELYIFFYGSGKNKLWFRKFLILRDYVLLNPFASAKD